MVLIMAHSIIQSGRFATIQWRYNEREGVSNHQLHDCLFNRLFKAQIKENTKAPRHWPLCGEFTGDRKKGKYRRKHFHFMTSTWEHLFIEAWTTIPMLCQFTKSKHRILFVFSCTPDETRITWWWHDFWRSWNFHNKLYGHIFSLFHMHGS